MTTYKQIIDNGPTSNRINIVIIGDGYTQTELVTKYPGDYNKLINDMFLPGPLNEPFNSYSKYFNVYVVSIASKESGADQPLKGIYKDTALGSSFSWGGGVERALGFNTNLADIAVTEALEGTNVVPHIKVGLVNTSKSGGSAYPGLWGVGNTGPNMVETTLHEIGHSYAFLADEYSHAGASPGFQEPSEVNVTWDKTGAKWSHWMGYDDGILGPVGVFEGAKYMPKGAYRPTENSKMKAHDKPFNAISQEALLLQYYTNIDHADDFSLKGFNFISSVYTYSIGESVNGGKSDLKTAGQHNSVKITNNYTTDTLYATLQSGSLWADTTKYKISEGYNGYSKTLRTRDVLRIEDSKGKVLADIDCSGDNYVINADGTITQTNGTHAMQFISAVNYVNNPGAFFVDPIDKDKITIEWTVAGNKLDSKKGKYSLEVQDLNLSNGTHKVTATLEDPTTKVRKSNTIMKKTIDWHIKIDNSNTKWTTDGTFGDDTINLGDGNDVVSGQEGNDTIKGGKGNDTITGGEGNDILHGGAGNDIIDCGAGDDTIDGGDGDDTISSGTGSDLLKGNNGSDKIYLKADGVWATSIDKDGNTVDSQAANISSSKTIFEKVRIVGKNKFDDVIEGNNGIDVLNLTAGSDAFFFHDSLSSFNSTLTLADDTFGRKNVGRFVSIETINGGDGNDLIDLTSPDTQISDAMIVNGGAGNDVIWSSAGTDTLNGGDGDDVLFGAKGIDNLTGGNGADTFEFCNQSGNDIIKDYNKSDGDKLAFYIQNGDNKSVSFSGDTITWGSLQIQLEGLTLSSENDFIVEYDIVA